MAASPRIQQSPSLLSSSASITSRPSREYLPLSNHGMPKAPSSFRAGHQSQRFSSVPPPVKITPSSPPLTPMSASPLWSPPPLSARSFDTFIDTEPDTPSFSPRSGSTWEGSTIIPLTPMSSSLSPIESIPGSPESPSEPAWEMMSPNKAARKEPPAKIISALTPLSSHPPSAQPSRHEVTLTKTTDAEVKRIDEEKENEPQDTKSKSGSGKSDSSFAVPLEKLATRMKSILRRKPNNNRKAQKKKLEYHDLDRMEDVHWTEM